MTILSYPAADNNVMTAHVHIVGPHCFQNELLAYYLMSETELICTFSHNSDRIKARKMARTATQTAQDIILWDGLGRGADLLLDSSASHLGRRQDPAEFYEVLYNVTDDRGLEKMALRQGFRGLLPCRPPIGLFPKAIAAIQKGELWFSREILSQHVITQKTYAPQVSSDNDNGAVLTTREKEILLKITAGAATKEIARSLCISSHTVKTHLHNTFKKIAVTTRTQAAHWARNNLI